MYKESVRLNGNQNHMERKNRSNREKHTKFRRCHNKEKNNKIDTKKNKTNNQKTKPHLVGQAPKYERKTRIYNILVESIMTCG